MPNIGDLVLHYQILAHLGKGGMGTVYRALDTRLGREVALKFVLNQEQLRPEQKERLLTEAKVVARFQHPNIAQIYAIEDYGEDFFLAMAFYEGESLDKTIQRQGELPLYIVLELFEQLLEGLGHAHAKGVIHRDIKPANVFVTHDGVVKILDFGTAHLPGSRITQKQQWIGSLNYMPPEQFQHEDVDIRSDIWSLGVLLFELLTGKLPFKGEFPQIMLSILKDSPQSLTPYIDAPALQHIIERCLAKDRNERFKDCQALWRSLQIIRADYHDSRASLADYLHSAMQVPLENHAVEYQDSMDIKEVWQETGVQLSCTQQQEPNQQSSYMEEVATEQQKRNDTSNEHDVPQQVVATSSAQSHDSSEASQRVISQSLSSSMVPNSLSGASNSLQRRQADVIGRSKEVEELLVLLVQDRNDLVTLTGLGGTGKTSLAQSVVLEWQIVDNFPDGRYFVDLSVLQDTQRFAHNIAQVLAIHTHDDDMWGSIIEYIGDKHLLLVLDNIEHLLPTISLDIEKLLGKCANLSLLVTSREVLNLPNEIIYDVQGLSVPSHSNADFYDYGATALFLHRAKRINRNFDIEKFGFREAIFEICTRLEGWPLGIELAVSWIRQLTPQQISAKLRESLDFLSTRARTRNESLRQQSARAVFSYSWDMLGVQEQDALAKLAVFQNRFTLRGAQEVAEIDLPMIASFVDKSLLTVRSNESYSRHPLILEFCKEKLEEQTDVQKEIVRKKHAHYFLALMHDASQYWRTAKQLPWLNRVNRDIEDIYRALQWFYAEGAVLKGLELAVLVAHPSRLKNYYQEGRYWLQTFVALDTSTLESDDLLRYQQLHGDALYALASLEDRNYAAANSYLNEAKTLYHDVLTMLEDKAGHDAFSQESYQKIYYDARLGMARCLQALSHNYSLQGKIEEVHGLAEQSMQLFKVLEDSSGMADVLSSLGLFYYRQGQYTEAQQSLYEAYSIYAANEDIEHTAFTLHRLGNIALEKGKFGQAKKHYEESITLRAQLGDEERMALSRINIGYVHQCQGEYTEAKRYYDNALEVFERIGSTTALAWIKNNLAWIYHNQGDSLKAERFFHESLISSRQRNDRQQIAWVLQTMAKMKLDNGMLDRARFNLRESLALFQEFGDRYNMVQCLYPVSRLAVLSQKHKTAVILMSALDTLKESLHMIPFEPVLATQVEETMDEARTALGEEEFQKLWDTYTAIALKDVVGIALDFLDTTTNLSPVVV